MTNYQLKPGKTHYHNHPGREPKRNGAESLMHSDKDAKRHIDGSGKGYPVHHPNPKKEPDKPQNQAVLKTDID